LILKPTPEKPKQAQ